MPRPRPNPTTSPEAPAEMRPQLAFDWRDWLPYLAEAEGTEEEKRQLIETLWSIIQAFVDLGWEVRPEALSEESCGQDIDLTAVLRAAVVHSEITRKEEV